MSHVHRVHSIENRGKRDSVCVVCTCGKSEIVAEWDTKLPKGWNQRQSEPLLKAIPHFLDAWAWSFPGTKTAERKNAADARAWLRKRNPKDPLIKTITR